MAHDNLWAPWRMEYIKHVDDDDAGCFLCEAWQHPDEDEQRLVVHRDKAGMILLNRYPYTNGHLLVALGDHTPDLPEMTAEQRASLFELVCEAERLLKATLNPQGINIGINVGRCAGAGLPGHLHVHLVPRWSGDTNFMQAVGAVRVIPQALEEIHEELTAAAPKVFGPPPDEREGGI